MTAKSLLLFAVIVIGCGAGQPKPVGGSSAPPAAESESASAKGGPEVERAVVAIKANDFRSAKAALDIALEKNPKNGLALHYMGVCLENLGDKKGAEARYKAAIENAPDIADASVNLGAIYLDASRWADAIAVSEQALVKRPDDPALHANLAVALQGKGDKDGAKLHYGMAVKVIGDNASLRFGYGSLLLETGDKEGAAVQLKAALAHAGSDRALLASIGRGLGAAGAFADCVAAFDHAIQQGDEPEFRVRRGVCRHQLNDESGAKADFEAAVKQDPKFAPAHYYLGESLMALGDNAGAVKAFEAAIAAQPQDEKMAKKAREKADLARKKKGAKKK